MEKTNKRSKKQKTKMNNNNKEHRKNFFLWQGPAQRPHHSLFSFVVLRMSPNSFGRQFPQRRRSSRDRKGTLPEANLQKQHVSFLYLLQFWGLISKFNNKQLLSFPGSTLSETSPSPALWLFVLLRFTKKSWSK